MLRKNGLFRRVRVGGLPTRAVLIPAAALLAVLLAVVAVLIITIDRNSAEMSQIMQKSARYIGEAGQLQIGSTTLSETAGAYVLRPETEIGYANVAPLLAYANELAVPRRGAQIARTFAQYDVDDSVRTHLEKATRNAERMMEAQCHAIALTRTAHHLPDYPELAAIPDFALSDDELTLNESQSREAALGLLFGETYSRCKQLVSDNVTAATEEIAASSERQTQAITRTNTVLRTALWVAVFLTVLLLSVTFIVLFRSLVAPLLDFARRIHSDDSLAENRGLYEVRLLAVAYNGLLRRRKNTEQSLRSAAETDPLTGLPNRFYFDRALEESTASGRSLAVFSFDLNGLKQTNDTQGHSAGDELLRRAGACIVACFGDDEGKNCFRFGGDEFAAIVRDCTPEDVGRMLAQFEREQAKRAVSVAIGSAYAPDSVLTTGSALFEEADRRMYECKAAHHAKQRSE